MKEKQIMLEMKQNRQEDEWGNFRLFLQCMLGCFCEVKGQFQRI